MDPSLSKEEKTEFRSCTGSLQFISGSTRPDLAASTSLIQGSDVTIDNLDMAYRVIDHMHDTKNNTHIVFSPHVDLYNMMVVGFGDSSFANAENLRTQIGILVTVTNREALKQKCP